MHLILKTKSPVIFCSNEGERPRTTFYSEATTVFWIYLKEKTMFTYKDNKQILFKSDWRSENCVCTLLNQSTLYLVRLSVHVVVTSPLIKYHQPINNNNYYHRLIDNIAHDGDNNNKK